ncbi:long neurotoxin 1-like isoform X2 [Cherax quadricarinatus]
MGVRAWQWAAVVVLVGVVGPSGSVALRCYKCNNCIKFELSQSQTCSPEETRCMKMKMETGQVQRGCGTEEMCANSEREMKTHYKGVSCCSEDNCNPAPTSTPAPLLLLLLLLLPAAAAAAAACRLPPLC